MFHHVSKKAKTSAFFLDISDGNISQDVIMAGKKQTGVKRQ